MDSDKKVCPYCGEEIMAAAKKCKHCGEWLDDSHQNIQCMTTATQVNTDSKKKNTKKYLLIGTGVLVGAIAIVLIIDILCRKDYSSRKDSATETEYVYEDTITYEEIPEVGNPIEEVPEYILTHDADGNGEWVKNPDYIDGSDLYDGTEDGD